jgi:hypothetical protein
MNAPCSQYSPPPPARFIQLQLRIHSSVIRHVNNKARQKPQFHRDRVSHHRNNKFSTMNITFSNSGYGGPCHQHRVSLFTVICEKYPPCGIYDRKRCSKEDSNNTTHIATGRSDWGLRSSLSSGYFLPTSRDNLLLPSSGVLDSTPEEGTDKFSRNVGKRLPLLAA